MLSPSIKLIECPRDAIQGISNFICTEEKVEYYQSLLKVGFDTLDCGSFVSPKVIPQMADTSKVISALDLSKTKTKRECTAAMLIFSKAINQITKAGRYSGWEDISHKKELNFFGIHF